MKSEPATVPEGVELAPELTDGDTYPFKMNDVAVFCGIHRVTLLRMLQAGKLSVKPKWRKRPNPHRVFSKEDVNKILKDIEAMAPADRDYVDEVIHEVETEK